MVTKFTRKELERLECSEEEISLVMEYQKRLPVLIKNAGNLEQFCVNAFDLYLQLNVRERLSRWIESNIIKHFELGKDYNIVFKDKENNTVAFEHHCSLSPQKLNAIGVSKVYLLSLDTSKEIAMFAGTSLHANEELKKTSRLVRQYFILMERIVIDNKEWLAVRDPEKIEYKKMSDEVNAWMLRNWRRKAAKADYAVEADMLNVIIFGKTSQQLKSELHIGTFDLLRDYLKKDFNEELLFLEIQNQILLQMDMGFTARKEMLERMYLAKFGKKAELNVA